MTVLIALACQSEPDPALAGRPAALLQGREAIVDRRGDNGELASTTLRWGDGDTDAQYELTNFILDYCAAQVGSTTRLSSDTETGLAWDTVSPAPWGCGLTTAVIQQMSLCAANVWQTAAESVVPVQFYAADSSSGGSALLTTMGTDDDPPNLPNLPGGPMYSFPIAEGASGRATYALAAVEAYRLAITASSFGLDTRTCPDGTLVGTVVARRDPISGWVADEDRIALSTLVVRGAAEAAHGVIEAGELAERHIAAAADERLANDRDRLRANNLAWRGRHDSRLEIASMWVGSSEGAFSDDPRGPQAGTGADTLAVCNPPELAPPRTPAANLFIDLGLDPRELAPPLIDQLQDAMIADYPDIFGATEADTMTPADFLVFVGVDETELRQAGYDVVNRADVTGRPIVSAGMVNGVPRVLGTAPSEVPTSGAYIYAGTAGAIIQQDAFMSEGGAPTEDYGIGGTPDYVNLGILSGLDGLSIALGFANGRDDVDEEAQTTAQQTYALIRDQVPLRLVMCMQADGPTSATEIQLRVYGNDLDPEQFELWWDSEGLECALRGSLYGVPCDLDAVRITTTPTAGLGAESGREGYIEWVVEPSDLPGSPSTIAAGEQIYISQWVGTDRNRRVVVAAVDTEPGPDLDLESCYRYAVLPAGTAVMNRLERALAASPSNCSRPATTCAGVPFDVRLPLEDELTEASEGRDDIESSFTHYLRLARSAADEADRLGEELVRTGLEMDLRAEAAADELQSLCGVPVSASSFPSDPIVGACVVAEDCCHPANAMACGDEARLTCLMGYCVPNDITALIAPGELGTEALRRCLGTSSERLAAVALGGDSWYTWRGLDGDLGSCVGFAETIPPIPCPLERASRRRSVIEVVESDPRLHVIHATPLRLVDSLRGSSGVPDCDGWARIIAGQGPPESFDGSPEEFLHDVLEQDWFSYSNLAEVGNAMTFGGGALETGGLYLSGRRFASLGTFGSPEDRWPCARWPGASVECVSPPSGVAPLRCGGSCASADERIAVARRMVRALEALQGLSQYSVRPATGSYGADERFARYSDDFETWLEDDTSYCSAAGLPSGCLHGVARLYEADESRPACISDEFYPGGSEYDEVRARYGMCPFFVPARRGSGFFSSSIGGLHETSFRARGEHSIVPDLEAWVRGELQPTDVSPIGPGRIDVARPGDRHGTREERGLQNYPALHPHGASVASTEETLLALELVCMARESGTAGCGGGALPPPQTLEDLGRIAQQIRCEADAIESSIDALLLVDVPESIAEDLRTSTVSGSFPGARGEYGVRVAELRAVVEELPENIRAIATILRSFAGEIEIARSRLSSADLTSQIDHWVTVGEIANEAARCISSIGDSPWSSGAQCAAAVVNTVATISVALLRDEMGDNDRQIILGGVGVGFGEALQQMENARAGVVQAYARINGILSALDTQRAEARSLATRMMFLDTDAVGREAEATRSYRARLNTLSIRYNRAHERAIRMTYLARRAVEQRLGVDLSSMYDDMTLVPPPATWADGLCSMRGLDYSETRGSGSAPGLSHYADRYVGDYVTLLEDFIESYRLDFPFSDGDDVALISLRDDLRQVREPGLAESYNLFLDTEDPAGSPLWFTDCEEGERCVIALDNVASAFRAERDGRPGDPGYRSYLRTVGEGAAVELASLCPEADRVGELCPHEVSGTFGQEVALVSGREYLVSWYEPLPETLATPGRIAAATDSSCVAECTTSGGTTEFCADRCLDVHLLQETCAAAAETGTSALALSLNPGEAVDVPVMGGPTWIDPTSDRWVDGCNWQRFFVRFRSVDDVAVFVGFEPIGAEPTDEPHLGWAMPQLEVVPLGAESVSVGPAPFMRTDDDYVIEGVALREDTDGSTFRSGYHWRRGCEYLCPDGLGAACGGDETADRSLLRCYWETDFGISVDAIERGELLPTGGFAEGNFNYRFRDFAVNVVGTGVRDCSAADSPTSCYASGFIPYSLYHDGPFHVRNHLGELIEAPLFNGRVHFAKALAAERYLTNPVSSADRALLGDYYRREFRGRPIDGQYRLRLYEVDGFNWDRVEDVQIILNYRYWTRFR